MRGGPLWSSKSQPSPPPRELGSAIVQGGGEGGGWGGIEEAWGVGYSCQVRWLVRRAGGLLQGKCPISAPYLRF